MQRASVLTREEAGARFGVSPAPDTDVLFQPDAGIVYADRALDGVCARAQDRGGPQGRLARRARGAGRGRLRRPLGAALARAGRDRPPRRRDARDRRLLRARGRDPVRRRRGRDQGARLLLAPRSGSWSEGRQPQARHARRPGRRRRPGPGARRRRSPSGPGSASRARIPSRRAPRAASTPPPTTSGSSSSATAGSSSARPAPATPSSSRRRSASGSPRSRPKRSN